jgi:tRNA (Thr-GGU) A37 N-methylase
LIGCRSVHERRKKNRLEVEGVDVLNQTPLLDIKPYVPRFDVFETATEGWFTDKEFRQKPVGRE